MAALLLGITIVITITNKDGSTIKETLNLPATTLSVNVDVTHKDEPTDTKIIERMLPTDAKIVERVLPVDPPKTAIAPFDDAQAKKYQQELGRSFKASGRIHQSIGDEVCLDSAG